MTREDAKELLPIVKALAEGKMIQGSIDGLKWFDTDEINFEYEGQKIKHRIKPEQKYRPFKTQEECWNEMHNHPDFGWVKRINGGYKQIMSIHIDIFNKQCAGFAGQTGTACFEFEYIYKKYTFTDGKPFGIKE